MSTRGKRQKHLGTYGYSKLNQHEVSDGEDEKFATNSKQTGVKVFEVNSDDEGHEDGNAMTMKTLKRSLHDGGSHVEIYEIDISGAHGNESLQRIALKYSCSVWELKRVNNMLNAQDFHALNKIRIPAMKNSYRAELLQRDGCLVDLDNFEEEFLMNRQSDHESHGNTDMTTDDMELCRVEEGVGIQRDHFFRTVSIRDTIANDSESGDQFLRHMDHDLARIRETVHNMKDNLCEVTQSLTEPRFQPLTATQSFKDKYRINGVDCGIAWRTIICIGVFIGVILPIAGLLFYFFS